jgi:phosphate/phosphite/phosphonate ABC transporter binding protein
MQQLLFLVLAAAFFFCSAAADASPEKAQGSSHLTPEAATPLVFIIPPVENVSVMYEKFLPLKDHLERALSRKVVLKVASTHEEAIESIGTGRAYLAFFDPSAYCEVKHRYGVVPLVKPILGGTSTYASVIVARKDSPIRKIIEAKGKRLALGNVHSSSSHLIPAVIFKEVGITFRDFASVDYLEQEDRIALSVLTRRHDLGGLSERVAKKYLADGLRIVKTSEPIPQYAICACACLPAGLRAAISQALLAIDKARHPELIAAMKDVDGFAPAEDRDFDVVRVMIKNLTGKNYLVYGKNTVKVAHLPLYSAITLFDRFDPLMRYLSKKTGYEFKLVVPKDFEDFFDMVRRGDVEFSYSNPYIYIQLADAGHLRAFATTVMQTSGDIFRGIIITHRDSSIRTLEDLKGKDVMIVSYKSAGGFLAQQLLFRDQGIDVFKDLRLREGKRQEEVILSVYRRAVDAGFVRESALDVLQEEIDLSRIRIVATTAYIANWPFAATKSAPERLTEQVRKSLLEIGDRSILSAARVEGFKAAADRDFDSLRERIHRHEPK